MGMCLPRTFTICLCLSGHHYVSGQTKPKDKDTPAVVRPLSDPGTKQALIDDTHLSEIKRENRSVVLFNGKDLEGWTHVLADPKVKMDEVWKVREGGIRWCRGKPTGYLRTKRDDFENYELTLEWRWPPGTKGGNNGVLVHTTDPGVLGVWPRSFEVQLLIGNAGDIWVIGTTIEIPNPEGRIKERRHINLTDGSEKPIGEWNKLRVICDGDELTIFVNGDEVNYARKLSQTKGAICLQSEGAEIEYREIELRSLGKKE
jgi:3-keto-disaccharide hydrolase